MSEPVHPVVQPHVSTGKLLAFILRPGVEKRYPKCVSAASCEYESRRPSGEWRKAA